jgi:prevent-host-death family protein
MRSMPNIKPISDLRNYTDVLREVRDNNPVYLTRNGRGEYAIVKIGELDRLRASVALMAQLEDGEKSAREGGWVSADDVEAALGL